MSIVGFNFKKIEAERKSRAQGRINIQNNLSPKEVAAEDLPMSTDDREGLRVTFEYVSEFTPNIGHIKLAADVLLLESSENKKKLLDAWHKDKSLPKEFIEPLFNLVLRKCNLMALNIADDVRLPSPIKLGNVKVQDKDKA